MTSDFGTGFIVCLLQFTYHEPRIESYADLYAKMHREQPDLFRPEHAMMMWADGASDHLRDIKRPPKGRRSRWAEVQKLNATMWAWRWWNWNTNEEVDNMTPEAAHGWVRFARKVITDCGGEHLLAGDPELKGALALDRQLGLKHIDTGDMATCTQPIRVD